jgi:Transglutaminase-like superfamily
MRHRLLVGPAQWWDRAVIVGSWVAVDLALRAGVKLPVLARVAHVSLDSRASAAPDVPAVPAPEVEGPALWPQLSLPERRRLRIVDVVAERWPFGEGQCLRRALVTGRVLERLHPRLSLGVARRGNGGLVAHAWLELDGGARLGYSDGYERLSPLGP